MRESLLTPSLSSPSAPSASLYSVQSALLVAFLGGNFAIILYAALNSWKLRRPMDALAYVAALAVVMAVFVAGVSGWPPMMALVNLVGSGSIVLRALALLLFGAFYLLHRKQHRSAALLGMPAASPWIAAISCIVVGYGISWLVVKMLEKGLA